MRRVNKHIHFMGIGGSGTSAVAALAKHRGYTVSGCDLQENTPYLAKIKKSNVPIYQGHSTSHLKNVDILALTPAALFQNYDHPEVVFAREKKDVMTWQEVLGKYLHKKKEVICIAGTHGKSTTTAMAALLFEKAGKDPSVVIGAKVNDWHANFRLGSGQVFITEADEFFDNFLNYNPEVIILNNIEMDHPDFFTSEGHVLESFAKFIKKIKGKKILILNQDSKGIKKLLHKLGKNFLKDVHIFGYTFSDKPLIDVSVSVRGKIMNKGKKVTSFSVVSSVLKLNNKFNLNSTGEHNVANALGVIILANLYKIDATIVDRTLSSYAGIGRRLELIGTKKKIKIYDDYAHHPTEIAASLNALRQIYQKRKIWVIVEPHSYSRTKALLKDYKGVFDLADEVIIGPIFPARDKQKFGITGQSIVEISDHTNISSVNSLKKILKIIEKKVKPSDVVVVMGAGESYEWSREILKTL